VVGPAPPNKLKTWPVLVNGFGVSMTNPVVPADLYIGMYLYCAYCVAFYLKKSGVFFQSLDMQHTYNMAISM